MAFTINRQKEDKKELEKQINSTKEELTSNINNVETIINDLEGNNNILINAQFDSPFNSSKRVFWGINNKNNQTIDGWYKYSNGSSIIELTSRGIKLSTAAAESRTYLNHPISLEEYPKLLGKEVTISAEIINYKGSECFLVLANANNYFSQATIIGKIKIDKTGIVTTTFAIPNSLELKYLIFGITLSNNAAPNDYIEIKWAKLELGNKATKLAYIHNKLTKLLVDDSSNYKTYIVQIDESNSNPDTSVTYIGDSVNLGVGSSEWDRFFGVKPCLFKNGKVVGYLNKEDFTKFEDDSPADLTSGSSGDVMIEVPLRGVSINRSGNILTIKMTNNPNDSSFKYYAHTRGKDIKDYIYVGAYKGFVQDNKLYSLSGKDPTVNTSLINFRTYAHNKGEGYEVSTYYIRLLFQIMYILKYKNLDSQTTIGQGVTSASSKVVTGGTNKKGMTFGSTSKTEQVKLFGLEDFWGNIWEWTEGLVSDANRNYLLSTTNDNFNNDGNGYTFVSNGSPTSDISGYLKKGVGTTEGGFLINQSGASASTYYSDGSYCAASRSGYAGGELGFWLVCGRFPSECV